MLLGEDRGGEGQGREQGADKAAMPRPAQVPQHEPQRQQTEEPHEDLGAIDGAVQRAGAYGVQHKENGGHRRCPPPVGQSANEGI